MIKLIIIIISVIVLGRILVHFLANALLFHPSSEIEFTPKEFGLEFEEVYFTSKNGAKLNGLFFPADEAKLTLMLFHGNAENVGDRLDFIKLLNESHLNVFYFDYQGYGKSEGKPSEQNTYDDAMAAYNYLIERKDVDNDFIVFFGRSLGGAIAIDLATKVKCYKLITEGTFSSIKDMGKVLFPYIPIHLVAPNRYDNLSKAQTISVPFMIIHGTEDEVVPFKLGVKLSKVAGGQSEFYVIDGASHNDTYIIGKDAYFEKLKAFLGI